jgi:hypothetical protein
MLRIVFQASIHWAVHELAQPSVRTHRVFGYVPISQWIIQRSVRYWNHTGRLFAVCLYLSRRVTTHHIRQATHETEPLSGFVGF